jgi:hypothetical protein
VARLVGTSPIVTIESFFLETFAVAAVPGDRLLRAGIATSFRAASRSLHQATSLLANDLAQK